MANNENISKKNYFFGLSNNVFVSDYQNNLRIIDLGPIITGHHFFFSDYQELKSKSYYEILDLFSHHLRSYIRNEKTFHNIKELAMATNPAEIEITLNRPTSTHIYDKNDIITEPVSNSVLIKQIKICNNLKIPEKVLELEQEKILTKDALLELQNNNFSNYYLIKLFSFGILGINKKIVPTRWSITAVDDILSKNLLETIVDKQSINKIYIFENYLLHNKFIIILLPGNYEYELYEINLKEIIINQMKEYIIDSFTYDHEFVTGKKEYSIQAGGYYAVRLAVCEYLSRINKQAKVIAIRFIYPEYRKSLGVWNVRENVRDAMKNKKYEFSSQDELLLYLKNVFGKDYLKLIKKSIILNQTRLFEL